MSDPVAGVKHKQLFVVHCDSFARTSEQFTLLNLRMARVTTNTGCPENERQQRMYQAKARHPLSPVDPTGTAELEQSLWPLLVAIGRFWKLTDDAQEYRSVFRTFLDNRIALNPLYPEFYRHTVAYIDELTQQHGEEKAYELLFTVKDHRVPAQLAATQVTPTTEVDFVQTYVVNELIQFRVAFGGFKEFGALNYCGYFGGANIDGQPVPYRRGEPS